MARNEYDVRGFLELLDSCLSFVSNVETGQSDIAANLSKLHGADFDRTMLRAASPAAVAACERAIERLGDASKVELQTWLDVG